MNLDIRRYSRRYAPAQAVALAAMDALLRSLTPPAQEDENGRWQPAADAPPWLRHLHETLDAHEAPTENPQEILLWVFEGLRLLHPNLALLIDREGSHRFLLVERRSEAGWQGCCLATGAALTLTVTTTALEPAP